MTDEPTATDRPSARIEDRTTQPSARTTKMDARWLTLQRTVAIAMIVVVSIPMVVITQTFIPPLAVIGVLFAIGFVLTWVRSRAGAITIGILSGLWLLLNLINISLVIDDLIRPSETLFFIVTLAMLVFGIAGLVGLVGTWRRMSGRVAVRTLQATGIVLLGGLLVSLFAGL